MNSVIEVFFYFVPFVGGILPLFFKLLIVSPKSDAYLSFYSYIEKLELDESQGIIL